MKLSESLSDTIQQKLNQRLGTSEEIRIAIQSDIDVQGQFNPRWLIATEQRVMALGDQGDQDLEVPLEQIQNIKLEPLVGGGRLELSTFQDTLELITYSSSLAAKFVEAARGIEQLAKQKPFLIKTTFERTHCEKCGRLLPEKDGLCPACVSKWRMLLRICGYLRAHTGKTVIMAGAFLLTSLADLAPPKITQLIIDKALAEQNKRLLFWLVLTLAGIQFFRWAGEMAHGWLASWLGARIVADIRADIYHQLELLSLHYHDKKKTGGLLSRVTWDTRNLRRFLVDGLPYLILRWLTCLGVIAMLFYTNWVLTLYILIPVPIIVYWGRLLWSRLRKYYHRLWQRWEVFYAHIQESLSGIREVKAFAQEQREAQSFGNNADHLFQLEYWTEKRWIFYFSTMGLFTFLGFVLVWLVGGQQVLGQHLSLGELMLFYFYLHMFYGPLRWLGQVNSWMTRAFSAAERIFEVIDTTPESYDDPNAVPMPRIRGDIRFEEVSFGYEASLPVLQEINLHIKAGEMIGLVGKSGAGKTTTINLICRFYDVNYGRVTIDGVDIRAIRLEDLRRQIGVVLQDPILFNGTIAENISYGRPEASFEEIMAAARAANAHNFILSKPDGYDTVIGERGSGLSGGEKQRISIARAILNNPRILILDEATSSVDTQTEKQLQEAIGHLVKGRTTIAIAHRLSTLRDADRLVILEQGKIVEVGTHQQLLARRGYFYNLVNLQKSTSEIIVVGI